MDDHPASLSRRSGGILLLGHDNGDPMDRIEVIDARLVGLDRDSKVVFQESDQLERADRIENSSVISSVRSVSSLGSSPGRNSPRM